MQQYGGQYYQPAHSTELINDIMKAINGEYSAIHCYAELAKKAPNASERNQINEIRNDEIKHYHEFSRIYYSLTGRLPDPRVTEPCPMMYREGLEAAFKDEQKTTDFYLDIADKAQDRYIKEAFKRAAHDEQNHAVWFLHFLHHT